MAVGAGSFLLRSLGAAGIAFDRVVAHDAAGGDEIFDGMDCLVNFALDPRVKAVPHGPELDFDAALARRIARRPMHYVMLSTRRVYGEGGGFAIPESRAPAPADAYGRSRAATEAAILDILDGRATILRLANVFGFERIPGRRTFFAQMLDGLAREGRITFDMGAQSRRDFLPVAAFAPALAAAARLRPAGIFNIGSGIATPAGEIARWVAEGYGRGALRATSDEPRDEFSLDVARARDAFGLACDAAQIRAACRGVGARLREAA